MTRMPLLLLASGLLSCLPAVATAQDESCKDNPLFTRMPNYEIYSCESSEFDAKQFPVDGNDDGEAKTETVEGAYSLVTYRLKEGATVASPLQILRNHVAAAKASGGRVVKEFGPSQHQWSDWADIQQQVATLVLGTAGQETWVHVGSVNDGEYYAIATVTRQTMAQEVTAAKLHEDMTRDGFVTLAVQFDTASAVLTPASAGPLDQAAAMLKANPSIAVEVAGHTDNVGAADANRTLSQQRADAVRAALLERGVPPGQVTAKGYGADAPVADNRSEAGRATNRRVELTRRP